MKRVLFVVMFVMLLSGCGVEATTPGGKIGVSGNTGIGGWLLQMEQQYTERYREREETRRYEAELRAETEARRQETLRWLLAVGATVVVAGLWMWSRRGRKTVIVQQAPMLCGGELPTLPEPMFWDVVDGEWAAINPDRREIVPYRGAKEGRRMG